MIDANLGMTDSKYHIGINTGFSFRPATVRVLQKETEQLYFQYWERRYMFYIGLEKKFKIIENHKALHSGPVIGLKEIYTYGNYRGAGRKPAAQFLTVPQAGWYLGNDIFTLKLNYERMNFDISDFDKGRLSLGITFNIPLKKKSLLEKQINWLTY